MPIIATDGPRQSEVLAHEYLVEKGFCRKQLSVAYSADLQIGSVLLDDGDGTWSEVDSSDIATLAVDVAVVIDPLLHTKPNTGDIDVVCLVQGPAGLKDNGLKYTGTVNQTNTDLLIAYIESNLTLVNVEEAQDYIA